MNECCTTHKSPSGTAAFFSHHSRRYAKRFRRSGLEKAQEYLLTGIKSEPILGNSILDIGCGVGQLHLTLLREGAERAVGVDLSPDMLHEAQKFAETFGLSERTQYLEGDFTQLAHSVPESDITVLDRVVCCYEDLTNLLHTSTGKTRRVFALSHPKENLVMEGVFKAQVFLARLFKWGFRPFWHNWGEMKLKILSLGFELVYENSTFGWQVLVFRRV